MVKGKSSEEIQILPLVKDRMRVNILGVSPMLMNRMPAKVQRILLLPLRTGRMTQAEKLASIKHDPYEEYRNSVYEFADEEIAESNYATRFKFPASAFKRAAMTAALEIPGTKKASIGRLLIVEGYSIEIFGIPQLYMAIVRNNDMSHTPDIRTRAILPEWACRLTVNYVTPNLKALAVGNLLAAAGEICGIGDMRQEKGAGDFGRWEMVTDDNEKFQRVLKMSREAQDRGLAEPSCFDRETLELLGWYDAERARQQQTRAGTRTLNGPTAVSAG